MSGRPCDSCKSSVSLVFCPSDSVALCLACDGKTHGPGTLSSRHARVWMCEVCEQAPASVTCKADAAALCTTCDSDIHSANPLARRHERVPVAPFHVKPSDGGDDDTCQEEAQAASWLMRSSTNFKVDGHDLKSGDYLFPDVDPYLDLDYTVSMDGGFGATSDSVVPVQVKTVPPQAPIAPSAAENCLDLDFSHPKPCYNFTALSHSVSSSSLDVGVVPDGNNSAMADISNPFGSNMKLNIDFSTSIAINGSYQATQLPSLDREARVLRYREKRKNRKFEKTIRYASRKAYAEVRPRIKGRFAKRTEMAVEVDGIYSSSTVLMADVGYGVVPTF
ncbi:zinc finger protein CONSTANS-LIKE 4-like [Magnolia sinica]|uniref:zinc finger protein CONSTANS-LIKE 4-like n=1 Tax=Magnolia sinica TaxID=86752 RepID=UPI0026594026|nr:zinc finger protein CONSTANS-LIKE 4-like [Magnolia sinica]